MFQYKNGIFYNFVTSKILLKIQKVKSRPKSVTYYLNGPLDIHVTILRTLTPQCVTKTVSRDHYKTVLKLGGGKVS